uniref:Chondroadherin like n=1 Tax=Cyanoderma ruficeps TaxID=181631 RepID=A0A8C3QWV4_9PASS
MGPSWGLLLLAVALGATAAARCPVPFVCDNLCAHILCLNGSLTAIPELTKKLDLRVNSFMVIPAGTFLATLYLTHLDLQHCKVERLEEGAFWGLGRLVYLNLASNGIALLYQESLDGLSSLQQLILEGNCIEEIQPGSFSHLESLTALDLRANALVCLPDMAFQSFQVLRWFWLFHNALHVLGSEAFAALPALHRLSLDHNELQALPGDALAKLDGATWLDLGHNPTTYMAKEALAMASLRHLFLDHTSLQDVAPKAFAHSPQLRMVDLQENQLQGLPPLAGAARLVRVSLDGNPLLCSCLLCPFHKWLARAWVQAEGACAAPPALRGHSLNTLKSPVMRCSRLQPRPSPTCPRGCVCSSSFYNGYCKNRNLPEIPWDFPEDTRLLNLRQNPFRTVPPDAFSGLKELMSLHLQRCSIRALHLRAFQRLESLVYLYLTDNHLSTLVAAAFDGALQLAYQDLDHNAFTRVPAGRFWLLPNLLSLHLQHNAIGELAEGDLAEARGLHWLYLAVNAIRHIAPALEGNCLLEVPTAALQGLPALSELKLSWNPIKHMGDSVFLLVASSLQHLYLDNMGVEWVNFLPCLHWPALFLSLICHISRWINKLNLRIGATYGSPAKVVGLKVKLSTFQTCPGWGQGEARETNPNKTKAASKPSKLKRSGKSPDRGFSKSRA